MHFNQRHYVIWTNNYDASMYEIFCSALVLSDHSNRVRHKRHINSDNVIEGMEICSLCIPIRIMHTHTHCAYPYALRIPIRIVHTHTHSAYPYALCIAIHIVHTHIDYAYPYTSCIPA